MTIYDKFRLTVGDDRKEFEVYLTLHELGQLSADRRYYLFENIEKLQQFQSFLRYNRYLHYHEFNAETSGPVEYKPND